MRFEFRQFDFGQSSAGPWMARLNRQPSWVLKVSLTVTAIVMALPLLVMVLGAILAVLTFIIVHSLLSGVASLLRAVGLGGGGTGGGDHVQRQHPQNEGRKNVDVIDWK